MARRCLLLYLFLARSLCCVGRWIVTVITAQSVPRFSFPMPDGVEFRLLLWADGTWRSLVAHLTGGQGVAGSNPVVPTKGFGNSKTIAKLAEIQAS